MEWRHLAIALARGVVAATMLSPASALAQSLGGRAAVELADSLSQELGAMGPPRPGADATSVELRWSAPEGCPSKAEVSAELAKFHIDANAGEGEIEARARVVARVRSDGAGGYVLLLDVTLSDGMVSQRLRSKSCEALASAGMLTVAVLTDPSQVEDGLDPEPEASSMAAADSGELGSPGAVKGSDANPASDGSDEPSGDAVADEERGEAARPARQRRLRERVDAEGTRTPMRGEGGLTTDERMGVPVPGQPRRLGGRLGVAGLVGIGGLPRMHAGGRVALHLRFMPGRGSYRALRSHGPDLVFGVLSAGPAYARATRDNELALSQWPAARAELLMISASLRECWEPALRGPRPSLCGGLVGGTVRGVGRGVPTSAVAFGPLLGLVGSASAIIPVGRRAQLELGFELEWALLRPRFEVRGIGPVSRGIPVGGRVVLGLHWGWGPRGSSRGRSRRDAAGSPRTAPPHRSDSLAARRDERTSLRPKGRHEP